MPFSELLGRTATLTVQRLGPQGAFLTRDPRDPRAPSLLLPRRELSEAPSSGERLEVFVYLDSEDRPIATLAEPRLKLGEVRFLRVTAVTRVGAFFDWGLPKELLVPFAEQTQPLHPGDLHPIGLGLDRSGRLCGTMRVRELLVTGGRFECDEIVEGEAWREEPGVGVFCILEGKHVGLLPASEPHRLRRGEQTRFRVQHVYADGKVELSLRGRVHEELESDAEHVRAVLARRETPPVGDRSSPEQVRALFGLSKKAFKRAVGRLLKEGAVVIERDGRVRLADDS